MDCAKVPRWERVRVRVNRGAGMRWVCASPVGKAFTYGDRVSVQERADVGVQGLHR